MVGSTDSLDFSSDLNSFDDKISIPLKCWQDNICLSNIWIPSYLLPSRQEPSNDRIEKGIFHTLEKKDSEKYTNSFSVYSEDDIFLSDSDEDILSLDTGKNEKTLLGNEVNTDFEFNYTNTDYIKKDATDKSHQFKSKQSEHLGVKKRTSNMKTMPSVDNLFNADNETTLEANYSTQNVNCNPQFSDFSLSKGKSYDVNDKSFSYLYEQESNQKKNKKKKKAKNITLDEFLGDYKEEDRQNAACNDYFQKLLQEEKKNSGMQINNDSEFPDLQQRKINFMHSENSEMKNSKPSLKKVAEILSPSNEIEDNINFNRQTPDITKNESVHGKLIIENIPNDVNEDDIHSFLCGYGEIKSFSLKSVGEFLTAYVEIVSMCDIDWIVECLNGTEAFGASTKSLKCYVGVF